MTRFRSAPTPVSIALCQTQPEKGNVRGNIERVRSVVAVTEADVALFPETCLSGYFVEGATLEVALSQSALIEGLGTTPEGGGPDLAIGFYEIYQHQLYNSMAYLTPSGGRYELVHVHRKVFLPTYGVFEESRFVEAGKDVAAFDTRFGRMGMLVCEDMWHSLPATILALSGATTLLVGSASPARGFAPTDSGLPSNLQEWDRIAPRAAKEHGIFVFVSQLVGSEGGKLFPGGSSGWGPDGALLDRGALFQEDVVVVVTDPEDLSRARSESPLLADLTMALPHLRRALDRSEDPVASTAKPEVTGASRDPKDESRGGPDLGRGNGPTVGANEILAIDPAMVESALIAFIRDEVVRRRGFEKVVIGVSGGVDSAVSLYLAARALGSENVLGIRMPYATSSQESLDHAALALDGVGVAYRTLSITSAVDGYVEEHEPDVTPMRRGNLAARLRSVVLFDQSARIGGLPLGTGNKSERLLGYYTWHADDSPPINPIGDLFKTQVWTLARHLGVPDVIVDKPASADLIRGVHDEDELGISYPKADLILYWFLKGFSPEDLSRRGFPEDEVSLVWGRLNSTHWKRELPTVAMLSEIAIGESYLRPVDY